MAKKNKLHVRSSAASVVVLATLSLVAILGPTSSQGADGPVDSLRRLAADFTAFGFEVATTEDPLPDAQGGLVIYQKTVSFSNANVAYVSVYGTGDSHGGQALALACTFDGAPCQPGPGDPAGFAPTGWINLLNEPIGVSCDHGGGGGGDCHDNGVTYQWCIPVDSERARHRVQVKMASLDTPTSDGESPVFMEAIHFYVDANFIRGENRCTEISPPGLAAAESSGNQAA